MEQNEANRKTISEIINLVESSQCDIIHIRDQLEETNNQLEHALQQL